MFSTRSLEGEADDGRMSQTSVYERVLGARFAQLAPTLQRYFGPIPAGAVGRGEGTYDTAGSRMRVARGLLALSARHDVLFPEAADDVPFSIENRAIGNDLVAVRRFHFAGVTRCMRDRMTVRAGRIVDRLGRRGGLEVALDARVECGGMLLSSASLAWRIGRLRIPLPHLARVTVSERAEGEHQRVDVRVRMALLGEVFHYTGSFAYRVESSPDGVGGRP